MVIWKDDIPFIVRDISDLRQVIDDKVFESLEEFIEEYVDNSKKISDLEDEICDWENQCSDLEDALEQLKEKYGEHKGILPALKDFIEVMDDSKLTKDQTYYWDRLKGVADSL